MLKLTIILTSLLTSLGMYFFVTHSVLASVVGFLAGITTAVLLLL